MVLFGAAMVACAVDKPQPLDQPQSLDKPQSFDATAYSVKGETAKGTSARKGVVAADPNVLPLGSKIQVEDADGHSGTYVVEDTGPAVKGHEIDIYEPNRKQAKKFGRKKVRVKVLKHGDGKRE